MALRQWPKMVKLVPRSSHECYEHKGVAACRNGLEEIARRDGHTIDDAARLEQCGRFTYDMRPVEQYRAGTSILGQ